MTAYEGDKIKLAPVAATYEIEIERTVQEGRYGVFPLVITNFSADEYSVFNIEDACFSTFYLTVTQGVEMPTNYMSYINEYLNTDDGMVACPMFSDKFSIDFSDDLLILTTKNYGIESELVPVIGTNFTPEAGVTFTLIYSEDYGYIKPLPEIKEKIDSPNTFVDKYGELHIGKDLQAGDIIRIKSTSTYINPSGETETLEDIQSVVVI